MSTKLKQTGKNTGIIAMVASSAYGVLAMVDPVIAMNVGTILGTVSKSVGLCA